MICEKELCSGCGLCAYICPKHCISMREDAEGFLVPIVDTEKCIDCGLCQRKCPAMNPVQKSECQTQYACYAKEEAIRSNSSSGGMATLMAARFVEKGGVLVGAKLMEDFRVEHVMTTDPTEIQKSKYVQSSILGCFSDIEKVIDEKPVLFIGCPCQVAAVKTAFGGKDHLFTVELLCHAANSPGLFRDYVRYLEEKNGPMVSYDFRSKGNGWQNGSVGISYRSGKKYLSLHRYDVFHNWFGKYLIVRESCYHCPYRTRMRVGDVTLGDFWGAGKLFKEADLSQGVSRCFVNTEKGGRLLEVCAGHAWIQQVAFQDAEAACKKLFDLQVTRPPQRDDFMETYANKGVAACVKKYPPITKTQYFLKRICRRLGL